MGVSANEPRCARLFAALPVSLKDQASFSDDTFCNEMVEPPATRVLARLPLGNDQDGDGGPAAAATVMGPLAVTRATIVASERQVTLTRAVGTQFIRDLHRFGDHHVV